MLPGPGFVELLTDDNGQPGTRIHLTGTRVAGSHDEILIELAEALEGEAEDEIVLWVRTIIDFDEDGVATDEDPFGLIERGGSTAQASFTFRFEADE